MTTDDALVRLFTFVPLSQAGIESVGAIRAAGLDFARVVSKFSPPSSTRDSAIQRVLEAVMLANLSIACAEPAPSPPSSLT
jgi:hypothetical protein